MSLLSIIDRELRSGTPVSLSTLGAFVGFFIVMLASEIASGAEMGRVGQQIDAGLRKDMTRKILIAPIPEIERFQSHRILSALQQDVENLGGFSRSCARVWLRAGGVRLSARASRVTSPSLQMASKT